MEEKSGLLRKCPTFAPNTPLRTHYLCSRYSRNYGFRKVHLCASSRPPRSSGSGLAFTSVMTIERTRQASIIFQPFLFYSDHFCPFSSVPSNSPRAQVIVLASQPVSCHAWPRTSDLWLYRIPLGSNITGHRISWFYSWRRLYFENYFLQNNFSID